MKLFGSKTEKEFREELLLSNKALQNAGSKLHKILEAEGHATKNACVLHWTSGQLEDFYTVIINGSYLVNIEIKKHDVSVPAMVERVELKTYKHKLSKMNQIRLAVAIDLARSV